MKMRWRTHEFILVTILTCYTAAIYLLRLHFVPFAERNEIYGTPYYGHGVSFNYYYNILFPQLVLLLIQYGCYVWLSKAFIPQIRLLLKRTRPVTTIAVCTVCLQLVLIIYIAGPVSNFIFYYLNPFSNHPGILISFFPMHPQPLANTFGGFGIATMVIGIYLLYSFLRERSINFFERPGIRRDYRILVANQVTTFILVYICIYPLLHVFFYPKRSGEDIPAFVALYTMIVPSLLLSFTVNIYWLFPSGRVAFPFRGPMLMPLLFVTAICTLPVLPMEDTWKYSPFLTIWAMQLLIIYPLSWFIFQQRKDQILQLRGREQELVRSKADLQLLRSQINPHFLFNTLNTLYGTALREKAVQTAQGIQQLGDMMRFMLQDNHEDFIPLNKEISYIKNYISLQTLRTPSSPLITIESAIDDTTEDIRIAPMLLIPFIENAFRYGISFIEPSWIKLSLRCDNRYIYFEIHNSIHPALPASLNAGSGTGIKNVQDRLLWMYPGRHALTIEKGMDEYKVLLRLEIK